MAVLEIDVEGIEGEERRREREEEEEEEDKGGRRLCT